jgi:hypothetical protein
MPIKIKFGTTPKWMPITWRPGAREVRVRSKIARCCAKLTIDQRGIDNVNERMEMRRRRGVGDKEMIDVNILV